MTTFCDLQPLWSCCVWCMQPFTVSRAILLDESVCSSRVWCESVGDRVSFQADQSDTARIRLERIEEKLAQREHPFGPLQEYHLPGTAPSLVFHTAAGIRSIRETAGNFQRRDPVLDEQHAQRLRRAVQEVEAGYCNASTTCSGEVDSATVRAVRGLYFGVDVLTDVPGSQLAAGAAAVTSLLAAVMGCQRLDSPARARSGQLHFGAQRKARQRARAKRELAT